MMPFFKEEFIYSSRSWQRLPQTFSLQYFACIASAQRQLHQYNLAPSGSVLFYHTESEHFPLSVHTQLVKVR